MKHGVAFRKLSRTSSHRSLMLRNLVTSLFQHEQVKTTLPKAREAARMAEQIITLGKQKHLGAYRKAQGFVLDQTLLPKIFGYFASRYAQRPGGYTRIHKFGNRFGDNAPHAVLELVDNPRDIKLEMTARAVGWELLKERIQTGDVSELVQKGVDGADELIAKELALEPRAVGQLRPATRWNLQKIMRYREPSEYLEIVKKAQGHIDLLLAKPVLMRTLLNDLEKNAKDPDKKLTLTDFEKKRTTFYRDQARAGQALPGDTKGALRLAQGALARPARLARRHRPATAEPPKPSRFTFGAVYGKPSAEVPS